jgi:hypothetical protein
LQRGMRFVDPCEEAIGEFLEINGDDVTAVGGNAASLYMIDEINLRSGLHRLRRRRRIELAVRIGTLEALCAAQRQRVPAGSPDEEGILNELARMEAELQRLWALMIPGTPWDAPTSCLCEPR